ncbi:HpsJ family protein [Synechococcus sp. AH-601-P18]|nr:HpsJ family protein [Synechococcus sp. AH-601-P18]MDP7998316.1 HpsJ family protein [Synechococcus sp. SP1 MAG]
MTGTETGRLASLLRWLGLTMVLVLVLQMAAVLVGSDWSAEATSPQITGPLVALAPLGFIGLLTCLIGSRLENPQQQVTPLRAVVCVLSALLAIGMLVAVPMSLSSGAGDLSQAQNIEQGRAAMKEARAFRDNPEQVASLGEQLAQAGQLAADASKDDKQRAAETMIDEQISQMATQLKRVESQKNRESRQRLIGGTATAVVLAIAFVLLALTAVI